MTSTEFEELCTCSFLLMCFGLVVIAIDRYGGPAGKMFVAGIVCLLAAGITTMAWRVGGWRIALPSSFVLASVCASHLIGANQAATPWGEFVPGYPWYLTSVAYYSVCYSLLGIGIALGVMLALGREPEWMCDLLD
jgi:hypothetical protein